MVLKSLELTNFRNFPKLEQAFNQNTILILGPNGSGKSNLLEAINFLAWGSSPRVTKDAQVIFWDQGWAVVTGQVQNSQGITHRLSVTIKPNQKILDVDNKAKNLLDFAQHFSAVVFSPSDLSLLEGSPRRRRRFMDQTLSALTPKYLVQLADFKKILKNRNALLRKGNFPREELAYWSNLFVNEASLILIQRVKILRAMNEALARDDLGISLKYIPSPSLLLQAGDFSEKSVRNLLSKQLSRVESNEMALGFSLFGPQRDDFRVKSRLPQDLDLGIFGSRGEQRMATIQLKKAQLNLIEEEIGEKAVFLLDDIFSELDSKNQREVLKLLPGRQTFVTNTALLPIFRKFVDFQSINLGNQGFV